MNVLGTVVQDGLILKPMGDGNPELHRRSLIAESKVAVFSVMGTAGLRFHAISAVYGFGGRTASSAYFDNMTMIDKSVRHDGIGRISFGAPVSGEWRWGRNNPPRPPTFDDVDSADSVYQIAAQLREKTQKPGILTLSR